MLSIDTSRFGKIEIDEDRVIRFPEGLLGFTEQRDFAILSSPILSFLKVITFPASLRKKRDFSEGKMAERWSYSRWLPSRRVRGEEQL